MDWRPWAMKAGSILLGVGVFVVAATVLKGSGYEVAAATAAGVLIGLPINLGAKQ